MRPRLLMKMNFRLLPVFLLVWLSEGSHLTPRTEVDEKINVFNPKMDYDDWTPLGRGDPLKNDPTYDYVPPVLERVHYWIDPDKRTPDPPLPNSGILILEPKTKVSLPIAPPQPQYLVHKWKEADSRLDASSLLDPFFKFMEPALTTQQKVGTATPSKPFRYPSQRPLLQRNYTSQVLQRPPHTILMPPPLPTTTARPFITTVDSTRSAEDQNQTTTMTTTDTSETVTSTAGTTTSNPTIIANTENVFKAVAISMPDHMKAKDPPTAGNRIATTPPPPRTTTSTYLTRATLLGATPSPKLTEYTLKKDQDQSRPIRGGDMAPTPVKMAAAGAAADSIFQRQKQTVGKTPFFLIIEGHSKVKTYGASKNPINKLITSNTIGYDDDRGATKPESK